MTESQPMQAAAAGAAKPRSRVFAPMRLPSSAPLLRMAGVFGKDVVQHARIVLTMLLATVLITYLPWLGELLSVRTQNLTLRALAATAPSIFLAMLITCSFVFGLVVSAAEVEERTIGFLDVLPASRMRHFAHKFGAALLMLIVWAIAASLLIGFLTDSGTRILVSVFTERISLFSVLNVPSSGFLTILQCVSLTLTGLICGMLFANIAPAAIVGVLAYCIYVALLSWIFDPSFKDLSMSQFTSRLVLVHTVGMLGWCALMVAAYPRLFRRWHAFTPGSALRRESSSVVVQRFALAQTLFRSRRLGFDSPQAHLLRIPTVLVALFALVVPVLFVGQHPFAGAEDSRTYMGYFFLLPAAVALISTGAWLAEERFAPKFEYFALPVSRERWFWLRVRAVLLSGAVIALCCFVGVIAAIYRDNAYLVRHNSPMQDRDFFANFFRAEILGPVLFGLVTGIVCLMQLGAMWRLFFRSRMIAAIFAGMVIFVWTGCAVGAWTHFTQSLGFAGNLNYRQDVPMPWRSIFYLLWIGLISIGLPMSVSYLAFCRSRLLETQERTRGSLALAVFGLLFIWGTFLITLEPSQLITILFVR